MNNPSTMEERQAKAERVAQQKSGGLAFNVCVGSPGVATSVMGNLMRWPITYDVPAQSDTEA